MAWPYARAVAARPIESAERHTHRIRTPPYEDVALRTPEMINLFTLGGIGLRGPDDRTMGGLLAQPKRLALLVVLAVSQPIGGCRRDTLLGMLWPDRGDDSGRSALRQALHFLRRELGSDTLVNLGDEIVTVANDALVCDVVLFRRACREHRLEDALAIYRGDFLPNFFIPGAGPEFDDWIELQRENLRESAIAAIARCSAAASERDDRELAIHLARRAISLAPEDENMQRRLLMLLYASGDRSGALRAYQDFALRMARIFGTQPSRATQLLIAQIRGGFGASATTTITDPVRG
jgi:DNA-binding SARP family transcriptional activator